MNELWYQTTLQFQWLKESKINFLLTLHVSRELAQSSAPPFPSETQVCWAFPNFLPSQGEKKVMNHAVVFKGFLLEVSHITFIHI